ncbi:MAG: thioredoxin family protein [Cohaesibacter sp.]|nr:thioredoxin family protein [Cohaesibacter sp.]
MTRTIFAAFLAFFAMLSLALADQKSDYKPGLIKEALAQGKTVLVDYKASWCSTCARQERVIDSLRKANPAYDEAITFINVDWDQYGNHAVTTERNVPRRSTLLLLKGNQELGRIVAGTAQSQIKALMDKAL